MKVLLTGSFGNIGTKVIDALLEAGHEVVCYDLQNKLNIKTAKRYRGKVEVVWGDISNTAHVEQVVSDVDAVVHNAAILPPFTERNPEVAHKVNVGGTQNIIAAIEKSNPECHLVFPSSISVHGYNMPDDDHPAQIDHPLHAEDLYAGHKIECEKLLDNSKVKWTVVRIGACLDADSKIGGDTVREGLEMMFGVNPRCRIEYVHTRDVAQAMVNAVNNPEAIDKKFFLGGGETCRTNWYEFNHIAFEAMGLKNFPKEAFGESGYYTDWMDTEESQRVLKFQQRTLEDYRHEFHLKMKWPRRLMKPVAPLVHKHLLKMSPHYEK